MRRHRSWRRAAVLGVAICLVGWGSSQMTASHVRKQEEEDARLTYGTEPVRGIPLRWIESSRLVQRKRPKEWKPATSGLLGGLLDHGYVWVPVQEVWQANSTPTGSFSWAYFRRYATLPFLAVFDSGVVIHLASSGPTGHSGGTLWHERAVYVCLFGYGVPVGWWQVGAIL
jgi:hypothetical protein